MSCYSCWIFMGLVITIMCVYNMVGTFQLGFCIECLVLFRLFFIWFFPIRTTLWIYIYVYIYIYIYIVYDMYVYIYTPLVLNWVLYILDILPLLLIPSQALAYFTEALHWATQRPHARLTSNVTLQSSLGFLTPTTHKKEYTISNLDPIHNINNTHINNIGTIGS